MLSPGASFIHRWLVFGLAVAATGCSIKASGSVAQPTALELQLLGAYRKLDDDLVRSASVRSAGAPAGPARPGLASAAMDARAMQRFNEDDVGELKDAGCLAETLDARIVPRDCPLATDPAVARRRARVIGQENSARRALLQWAAATLTAERGQDGIPAETRREVRDAYVRLLRQAARPGHFYEAAPGDYRVLP